jgi:hypothetical protein
MDACSICLALFHASTYCSQQSLHTVLHLRDETSHAIHDSHAIVDAYALRCRDMPPSDLRLSAGQDIACHVPGELEKYT